MLNCDVHLMAFVEALHECPPNMAAFFATSKMLQMTLASFEAPMSEDQIDRAIAFVQKPEKHDLLQEGVIIQAHDHADTSWSVFVTLRQHSNAVNTLSVGIGVVDQNQGTGIAAIRACATIVFAGPTVRMIDYRPHDAPSQDDDALNELANAYKRGLAIALTNTSFAPIAETIAANAFRDTVH